MSPIAPALLLASLIAAPTSPAAPMVTVRQVLTHRALEGESVLVTGRCLDRNAQAVAAGARPMSGDVWQLEDHGIATWVVGKMPSGCAEGEVTIRAKVAKDYLPKLSPARTARQYLVVE